MVRYLQQEIMKQTRNNKNGQIPDYLIFLIVPLIFIILLPFVDAIGKIGIMTIIGSTLGLLVIRYLNKEMYYSKSIVMTRLTISYFLILFLGNVLVFQSLFNSISMAFVSSIPILIANILTLKP